MKTKGLIEAEKRAAVMDKQLSCTDFGYRVTLRHGDGSVLTFNHALLCLMDELWLACFTEHHGFFVYHVEDLERFEQVDMYFGKKVAVGHVTMLSAKDWGIFIKALRSKVGPGKALRRAAREYAAMKARTGA